MISNDNNNFHCGACILYKYDCTVDIFSPLFHVLVCVHGCVCPTDRLPQENLKSVHILSDCFLAFSNHDKICTPIPIGKIGPKPNWLSKRIGITPFRTYTMALFEI